MKTFRIWLSYLLEPLFRLVFYVLFRIKGYSRMRIGTLTFWGPRDFLQNCTASLRRLQELDSELYSRVTTEQKLVFFYSPKQLVQAYFVWFFSIDDSYTVWKSDGIIARLVYSAQLAVSIPRRIVPKSINRALHSEVRAATRSWLEEHRFPESLVHCFQEQSV